MSDNDQSNSPKVSRRGLLTAGGAAIVGVAGGVVIGRASAPESGALAQPTAPDPTARPRIEGASAAGSSARQTIDFHGIHQAGVDTPEQTYATFLGLNLLSDSAQDADSVLRIVSDDAARLMAGRPALGDTEPQIAEVPARLSFTLGLGHSLFERTGKSEAIPAYFPAIPAFSTDELDDAWSSTDFLIQIASDDPLTLAHAQRMVLKDLSTLTTVQWMQSGFRSPTPANEGGRAGRNMMGQVDGTVNPVPGSAQFDTVVWSNGDSVWNAGGTVVVIRRIRMLLDEWDRMDTGAKELVIGRTLETGAPLGGQEEGDPVRFDVLDDNGLPVIPSNAHMRVAHAETDEEMILRRPYTYDAGFIDGAQDIGLIFAAYTADPSRSFIPMQQRIAEMDAFNRWNTTVGSSTYFIPPGCAEGDYLASGVFV